MVLQKEICNVLTEISNGDFDAMEVLREGLSELVITRESFV